MNTTTTAERKPRRTPTPMNGVDTPTLLATIQGSTTVPVYPAKIVVPTEVNVAGMREALPVNTTMPSAS